MWPADRARTPREYLGLMPGNDPRKPNLISIDAQFRTHLVWRPRGGAREFQCGAGIGLFAWGEAGMTFLSSLDPKDRKLLIICLSRGGFGWHYQAFFSRNQNNDDNPVPSSYLTGKHGARAAYDLLQASGYNVQRWEQPLSDLAGQADAQTVVILAEPVSASPAGCESQSMQLWSGAAAC